MIIIHIPSPTPVAAAQVYHQLSHPAGIVRAKETCHKNASISTTRAHVRTYGLCRPVCTHTSSLRVYRFPSIRTWSDNVPAEERIEPRAYPAIPSPRDRVPVFTPTADTKVWNNASSTPTTTNNDSLLIS
ncbi:unnamed protein product [Ectocarpus sp. 12 AP-2014]